jgi:phosphoribosyl-AMP cyclohydrolase
MPNDLEKGTELRLDFGRFKTASGIGVVPVAVQDADSNQVLLIGFASKTALEHTLQTRLASFWSFSRDRLWIKGDTSGSYLDMVEVRVNCEQNSLLYLVRPRDGGACHTRDANGKFRATCYYRRIQSGKLENVA